jgi:anaerobic selenocysteine-containing dehydrogenase
MKGKTSNIQHPTSNAQPASREHPTPIGGSTCEVGSSMLPPQNSLLRQWTGPLTRELVQRPGEFGLGNVPAKLAPETTTRATCGFCSTGCSLDVHIKDGAAVNLTPTADYPVNLGMACPKGWEALNCLSSPDRATAPLLRQPDGSMKPMTWDEAMKTFVAKFKAIMDQHGPESVAFLSTGQICTEEMALLGTLWKFGMGALHCDSNTRQCMATAHAPTSKASASTRRRSPTPTSS